MVLFWFEPNWIDLLRQLGWQQTYWLRPVNKSQKLALGLKKSFVLDAVVTIPVEPVNFIVLSVFDVLFRLDEDSNNKLIEGE